MCVAQKVNHDAGRLPACTRTELSRAYMVVRVVVDLMEWQLAKLHVLALGMRCAWRQLVTGQSVWMMATGRYSYLAEEMGREVLVTSRR